MADSKPRDEYDHLFKIILVGDATVGKTHLLSRYSRGTLPKTPQATIGVEFATQTVHLASGGRVKAQIWDTAGQERYRAITSAHYRRAVGALLVYDITKKQTFLHASKWLEDLRQNAEPDIIVLLVGNKSDLCEEDPSAREVPYDVAAQYAKSNRLLFFETSAVSNHNVKKVFEILLQEICFHKAKLSPAGDEMAVSIASGGGVVPAGAGRSFLVSGKMSPYVQSGIQLTPAPPPKNDNYGCCPTT